MEPKTLNRPLSLGIFLANVLDKMSTRISRLDFHFGATLVARFFFVSVLVAAHYLSDNICVHLGNGYTSHTDGMELPIPEENPKFNDREGNISEKQRLGGNLEKSIF